MSIDCYKYNYINQHVYVQVPTNCTQLQLEDIKNNIDKYLHFEEPYNVCDICDFKLQPTSTLEDAKDFIVNNISINDYGMGFDIISSLQSKIIHCDKVKLTMTNFNDDYGENKEYFFDSYQEAKDVYDILEKYNGCNIYYQIEPWFDKGNKNTIL